MTPTGQPSDADLARWEALCDAATEGPWRIEGEYTESHMIGAIIRPPRSKDIAYVGSDGDVAYVASVINDAEFIAEARTALPRLTDALRAERAAVRDRDARIAELTAEVERVRALLPVHGGGWVWTKDLLAALDGPQ